MLDFWETILAGSTLPESLENDLWDHLNNLGSGIVNVAGSYNVTYLGEVGQLIIYTQPATSRLIYKNESLITIRYIEEPVSSIHYVEQDEIDTEFTCN